MAEKQIVHIREYWWPAWGGNAAATMCGEQSNSVSYQHMVDWWNNKHKHVDSLDLCDDCYEEFKRQFVPPEYDPD